MDLNGLAIFGRGEARMAIVGASMIQKLSHFTLSFVAF